LVDTIQFTILYTQGCYSRFGLGLQISENRIAILVLDDDQDIVTILKIGLTRQGFYVAAFTDPNLALEEFGLNYKDYDLVISDIRLPQMKGERNKANS
jgi:DNA-binding NtrC family response regulator